MANGEVLEHGRRNGDSMAHTLSKSSRKYFQILEMHHGLEHQTEKEMYSMASHGEGDEY